MQATSTILPSLKSELAEERLSNTELHKEEKKPDKEQKFLEHDPKARKRKEREKAYVTNGRKINWSGRELRELPEKLFEFVNFDGLSKLILRSNQLTTFPGEVSMLRGLTYLDYSQNMVKGTLGSGDRMPLLATKRYC